jgi:hypothetical protein
MSQQTAYEPLDNSLPTSTGSKTSATGGVADHVDVPALISLVAHQQSKIKQLEGRVEDDRANKDMIEDGIRRVLEDFTSSGIVKSWNFDSHETTINIHIPVSAFDQRMNVRSSLNPVRGAFPQLTIRLISHAE